MTQEINKNRIEYFDNIKAILIFLVVLGHFANLNRTNLIFGAINNVIYSFHMPVFIFISGYFSNEIKAQRYSEIKRIIYPYIVFQLLNHFYSKATGLGNDTGNIFVPIYQNWYLLGLFVWRLFAPYGNFFKPFNFLVLSMVISFYIGFDKNFNSFLGLYRVIYFFPIFILGYYSNDLVKLLNYFSKYKIVLIVFFILLLLLIFFLSYNSYRFNYFFWYSFTPYTNYDGIINNFYFRIFGFFSSIVISFCFLFLVPNTKTFYSKIGTYSINIFLMHMFLVFSINNFMPKTSIVLSLTIAFISSFIICYVFSRNKINIFLSPFVNYDSMIKFINRLRFKYIEK